MAAARHNRKRRRNRGRFGFLFKFLCALALVVALTVGITVFFRVESIEVSGNSRYTQEDVIAATGIQIGDNMYHMNKYDVANHVLQQLPYIRELSIRRSLPSTMVIRVVEWDAVAQILPDMTSTQSGAAREAWLISAGGKLLEPAPEDSPAIRISGLTALMAQAGTMLDVSTEEQAKLDAALLLLAALEEQDLMEKVSDVEVTSTRINLRYMDQFQVKLPINGDFRYQMKVLEAGVRETINRHGEDASGTMDLTQKDCELLYSPD